MEILVADTVFILGPVIVVAAMLALGIAAAAAIAVMVWRGRRNR